MTEKPRLRTMGSQTPSVLQTEYHSYGPPPQQYPSPVTGTIAVNSYAGTRKFMYDIVHVGFKKTGDPSKWAMGPLTIMAIYATASSGSATTSNTPDSKGRGITRTWSGDGVGYIFGALVPYEASYSFGSYPDLVNISRLSDLAIIGCLNRINPAKSQSLVIAAEGNKTVDMILDRARKLHVAYQYARKGNVGALEAMFPGRRTKSYPKRVVVWDEHGSPVARKNGKVERRYSHAKTPDPKVMEPVNRLWLEYRYGWTPLVHDIVDSLKAINAQYLRDDLVKKTYTRVFERKEGDGSSVTQLGPVNNGGGYWTGDVTLTHKVSVKAYAKYRVVNESGVMNRLNDFGAFDVPRYLWEVVPFSFVVDWFIPIGDWLGAITPKVGVEVIDSGVTVVTSKEVKRVLRGYTPTSTGAGQWPSPPFPLGASDSFITSSKVRSIGLPPPLLPVPEVKLNFKRLADAVALFRGSR